MKYTKKFEAEIKKNPPFDVSVNLARGELGYYNSYVDGMYAGFRLCMEMMKREAKKKVKGETNE